MGNCDALLRDDELEPTSADKTNAAIGGGISVGAFLPSPWKPIGKHSGWA